MTLLKNPYGGGPGTGITLPPYYRPTSSMKSRNNFFPLSEELDADEMRITFVGSTPFPPRLNQAGTSIMVELGNGKKFFFDFGPGCMRNIIGLQHHVATINDIFISHLHVDHYHDLSYLLPFRAWSAGWLPLRVHGPSGRTPELGTQAMVDGMKQMLRWHLEAFDMFPIGDGYEVEVNEFDWKDENGICYDEDGVTVRHWRRSHAKDGATGYRLDWNGLSFVWTGDGRPDDLTVKYSKGVDVFVTELELDTGKLIEMKYGLPDWLYNYTIDTHHTPHYATGYMINEIQPRAGMVTHFPYEEDLVAEAIAGIRAHWKGLFLWGAPDGVVVNVTKDAIWSRKAAIPESTGQNPPPFAILTGEPIPKEFTVPQPRRTREEQQEQYTRDTEIDPKKYIPEDVYREPLVKLPDPMVIDLEAMMKAGGKAKKDE
ncbi:MAG: guanitoxin biosynthesis MBL fold metallo-hydrolase GntH [Chloroflexota bacterium]|nr:guanitoxin biosynthesis MBL fold metallo-hydrolase GntH [Chloroflexota bacterium]